jgi:predicted TIM-barrel fold metal-dependent hydrolase
MSGLIDTSVFCGYWPFRCLPHRTPNELKAHLEAKRVTQAWVAAAEAILYPDPMQANEPLFQALGEHGFFLPVGIIDVTVATWGRDAQTCLGQWGCRVLKLVPNYHQYELSDPRVAEFVALAEEANVPVCIQVRVMDERSHHPLMKVPSVPAADVAELASRHPHVRFLACGAYQANLTPLSEAPNVWAEISLVESGQALKTAVDALGPRRVVFGSQSPLLYFDAVAAKLNVEPADVPAEVVRAVRERNAAELLVGG